MKKNALAALSGRRSSSPAPPRRSAPKAPAPRTSRRTASVCHGDDGKGQTEEGRKKKARDLTNAKWQDTIDDARIVRSITKGHDEMPAFGKKLTEPEIKALAAEVRSLAKKPS